MNDTRRDILSRVASGTLSPQQAALELQELEAAGEAPPASTGAEPRLSRVRVVNSMGRVDVIGDESVKEALAVGPHIARREGDVLVIESDDERGGFIFSGGVRFGFDGERKLSIRMNPALPLEAEIKAGSLRVRGLRAPIKANVQAGSTRIDDFTEAIDLSVHAGSVHARGRLLSGSSHIHCQAGSVKLDLEPGSNVTIKARTSLGRINLPDVPVVAGLGGGTATCRLGTGDASLEIEAEMGSVSVGVTA